jgi:Flp pilus assembly protein TadD
LSPKNAWSLYGRGLAKRRLGRVSEAHADLNAALALQPKIADVADKDGIGP